MFGPISVLIQDPLTFLVLITAFLFGLVLHNVTQALVAQRFGDNTAALAGFSSTEPQHHFDMFNLIWYLLLGFCMPRSIPVQSYRITGGRNREVLVWASGLIAMLVWSFILVLVAKILGEYLSQMAVMNAIYSGLQAAASTLIIHAVIFTFPFPFTDGGHMAMASGNRTLRDIAMRLQAMNPMWMLVIFVLLSLTGVFSLFSSLVLRFFATILSVLPF